MLNPTVDADAVGEKQILLKEYLPYHLSALSDVSAVNGCYISKIKDLSLRDFVVARQEYCHQYHFQGCTECLKLISAAKCLISEKVVKVQSIFVEHFLKKGSKYKTDKAVKRLLQLPVIVFPVKEKERVTLYVTESEEKDCIKLLSLTQSLLDVNQKQSCELNKATLSVICNLASSETDKKLIKYTALLSSGTSSQQAKKKFGISEATKLKSEVSQALKDATEIQIAVNKLSLVQERCVLESLGVIDSEESQESGEESENDSENCLNLDLLEQEESCEENELQDWEELHLNAVQEQEGYLKIQDDHFPASDTSSNATCKFHDQTANCNLTDPDGLCKTSNRVSEMPSHDQLLCILRENKLNWFPFVMELKLMLRNYSSDVLNQAFLDFTHFLPSSDVTVEEDKLIELSRQAFLISECKHLDQDIIHSESESDDPEDYTEVSGYCLNDPALKRLVARKRKILKKKAKRQFHKEVAKRALLKRKVPARASKLLKKFPNLGKDIEEFVKDNRIGADAWRRTGVATFDGNLKRGPRVTYQRIKEHLEQKYKRTFSYGSVVQLSVVKNKRRKSAKRYWGAANVKCKRARKGFNVRLNIDAHWSAAFYKGLKKIQLEDGRDKCIINRDDAAGFRLDTTYTHKQHPVIADSNNPEITTRTDYVNKYSSILQTTSYLVLETKTTPQLAAGIVKPHIVFQKNPAQHASDLIMLQKNPDFQACLDNKAVDCIRVDGAADEGPSHYEVQFMWTERHLEQKKVCTLVTTRSSGSSYLNRVELQNGCLAVAHSNTYIPSTIHGSNFSESGEIDYGKLENNLMTAADVYISRCDKAPFADSRINLIKGCRNDLSKKFQDRRPLLNTFLNGRKKAKETLKVEQPELYDYFQEIWDLRTRHMVKNLPSQYLFQLLPCFQEGCPHPVCTSGKPPNEYCWYQGGPLISYLPIPIPDTGQPWGGSCKTCKGHCSGHYLNAEDNLKNYQKHGTKNMVDPPSDVFKNREKGDTIDEEKMAKQMLLPIDDIRMWNRHVEDVSTRRKLGAKKAAATRRANKRKNAGTVKCPSNLRLASSANHTCS